ncbi:hypothetical protein HDU93_005847 [Gonapodya sp. JEL0774]|nr:hypothetical protein HDU93_005847 [Gonapodya sp. JEL0774]
MRGQSVPETRISTVAEGVDVGVAETVVDGAETLVVVLVVKAPEVVIEDEFEDETERVMVVVTVELETYIVEFPAKEVVEFPANVVEVTCVVDVDKVVEVMASEEAEAFDAVDGDVGKE